MNFMLACCCCRANLLGFHGNFCNKIIIVGLPLAFGSSTRQDMAFHGSTCCNDCHEPNAQETCPVCCKTLCQDCRLNHNVQCFWNSATGRLPIGCMNVLHRFYVCACSFG